MSDANLKTQLAEASEAFAEGKLRDAEAILLRLPRENLKVKHNLVAVQYLLEEVDADTAIAQLEAGLVADGSDESSSVAAAKGTWNLQYEGHETAVFNLATILCRTGHPHRATALLRRLLELGSRVELSILAKSTCLFTTLTTTSLGMRQQRSEADATLADTAMKIILQDDDGLHRDAKARAVRLFSLVSDSVELMNAVRDMDDPVEKTMCLNNLGAFSLIEKKPYVATVCFSKAQEMLANACEESAASSSARASGKQQQRRLLMQPLSYNAGLCALLREEYEQAVGHFLSVQDSMKSSPMFWVRLGEAALGALQQKQRQQHEEEYMQQQTVYSQLLHSGHMYENFEFLLLPNAQLIRGPSTQDPKEASGNAPSNSTGTTANTTTNNNNSSAGATINNNNHNNHHNNTSVGGSAAVPPLPPSPQSEMEMLASTALQNALFLLVPAGHTYASARSSFPQQEMLLAYALLYWTGLELHRKNYAAVEAVGQSLLEMYDRGQAPPANLHATLLCYLVDALVHLNDPEKAMRVLRRCQPSSLITGSSAADQTDVAQRSRIEVLLIHVAITQILSGAWAQAASTMEFLVAKIFDSAPAGSTEFQPEADALFAYQILAIFLELAQGKQSEAATMLGKLQWSV